MHNNCCIIHVYTCTSTCTLYVLVVVFLILEAAATVAGIYMSVCVLHGMHVYTCTCVDYRVGMHVVMLLIDVFVLVHVRHHSKPLLSVTVSQMDGDHFVSVSVIAGFTKVSCICVLCHVHMYMVKYL